MPPVPTQSIRQPVAARARPSLPKEHFNTLLKQFNDNHQPPVKFQKIARPPKEVLVGRMKIPTPGSHAFILRRYDTGAISITTLFKAAFPTASEKDERDEISWVSHHHDLTGANGGTEEDRVRFSGRWAPPHIAQQLADEYGIGFLLPRLINAEPDPTAAYRGSGRASIAHERPSSPSLPNKQLMTPSPSGGPPPAKRRKEDSSPVRTQATPGRVPAVPTPMPKIRSPSPDPVHRTPYRAARSPPPQATPRDPSPRKPLSRGAPQTLTVLSDDTAVGEESEDAAVDKLAHPDMNEDVAEQRALIERLKQEREANAKEQELQKGPEADTATPAKRDRPTEEEPLLFEFKEPEVEARALVTNSRVRRGLRDLPPEKKSAAWGALAFAAGLGIATFVPNFFF